MAKKVNSTNNTKQIKSSKKLPTLNKKTYAFGLLAILLLSVFGTFGYNAWQENKIKAKAAGYTYTTLVAWTNGATLKACKQEINSAFGPLWQVNLVGRNAPSTADKIYFSYYVERGNKLVSTTNFGPLGAGSTVYKTAYASRLLGDTYSTGAGDGRKGAGSPFSLKASHSTITNCLSTAK